MKLNKTVKNIFCLGAIPLCILPIVSCSCNNSKPTPPDPWPDPAHYSFNATSTAKDVYDYQISPKKTYYFDISYEIMIDHEDFTKKTGAAGELILKPEVEGTATIYLWNVDTFGSPYYLPMYYDITCLSQTETTDTYELHIYDKENQIEKYWNVTIGWQYDRWDILYHQCFRSIGQRTWTYDVHLVGRGSVKIYK